MRSWMLLGAFLTLLLASPGVRAVTADTATPVSDPLPVDLPAQTLPAGEQALPPDEEAVTEHVDEAGDPPEPTEPGPTDGDASDAPDKPDPDLPDAPATEPVIAPPPDVNTDAFHATGDAATPLAVESGATITVTYEYAVTTTRASTIIHAALVNPGTGEPAGWSVQINGSPSVASTTSMTDVSATEPGSIIPLSVTITADSAATPGDTVLLRLWSAVQTMNDPEPLPTNAYAERYVEVRDGGASGSGVSDCGTTGSSTPTVAAEALDFGTLSPDGAGYPIVERRITLTITDVPLGCEAAPGSWVIRVSYGGMVGPRGETMPAHAMVYIGASGGAPAGVTPVSGPLALGPSPVTIATVDADVEPGTSWTVAFTLSPPGDMPPGDYAAPVTIEIAAAG